LESHRKLSEHLFSARRRGLVRIRRLTIVTETQKADEIIGQLVRLGASGYTITDCRGAGRSSLREGSGPGGSFVRIEMLVATEKFESMLSYVSKQLRSELPITFCADSVEVVRGDDF